MTYKDQASDRGMNFGHQLPETVNLSSAERVGETPLE
jgi:hypothetical protein